MDKRLNCNQQGETMLKQRAQYDDEFREMRLSLVF